MEEGFLATLLGEKRIALEKNVSVERDVWRS